MHRKKIEERKCVNPRAQENFLKYGNQKQETVIRVIDLGKIDKPVETPEMMNKTIEEESD